jgi:hypothetical protein
LIDRSFYRRKYEAHQAQATINQRFCINGFRSKPDTVCLWLVLTGIVLHFNSRIYFSFDCRGYYLDYQFILVLRPRLHSIPLYRIRSGEKELGFRWHSITFLNPDGLPFYGTFSKGSDYSDIGIIIVPGGAGNSDNAITDAQILLGAGCSTLIYAHRSCSHPGQQHSGG